MTQKELLKIIEKAVREKSSSLDLSGKDLKSLPPEIGQLTNLQELNLSQNRLKAFPPEIGELTNLQRLYLQNNQLSSLPSEIWQLTNLQELYLWGNQLSSLPLDLGKLRNLQRLLLGENQLSSLPGEIIRLTNLQALYLYNDQFAAFPPEIGKLTNLQELSLEKNQLTALPPEIGKLTNLQKLRLSNNQLTTLPLEIGKLTNLQELYLSDNHLSLLPPEIGQVTNLKELSLAGNPLVSPPPEVVKLGTKAILAYLREQLRGGEKQWISKLLLVGEGGVGKTNVLRRLLGENFTPHESTTHGIEIGSLKLSHPTSRDVTMCLNSWDFGGQEIYHATFQFFLTNRSLFLLVWNARHGFEQGKLYYWLDTIQARAPESPVIIAATFMDERDADIPIRELMQKYPQIIGHYSVSNKTGKGIHDLRKAITKAAAKLPLMGETWPATWLNAANALRRDKRKHITPEEMQGVMKKNDVLPKDMPILAQWLHELGDILYYQNDPEISDIVILKPQWVTQYISKVLEDEEVIDELGLFTRPLMERLWTDLDRDMQDHFLRLMEKFDLSYRTLQAPEISIVVERLNLDPPKYEERWNGILQSPGCKEISMRFLINSTIPAGVPTYFIARSHRFTTHTHWRHGALFAYDEGKHLGLIQSFPHERYLQLSVRGPFPPTFFEILRDGLELTLARFPGLPIERKMPCPGHDGEKCDFEFDFKRLQNAVEREKPVTHIQCQSTFENVSVSELLFGIHWSTYDKVLLRLEELHLEHAQILDGQDRLLDELRGLRELSQREFTRLFRLEQSKIESHCPNVFTLFPQEEKRWFDKLPKILGQKMMLQLYCQYPGVWHPTEKGGIYPVDKPPEWLVAVSPIIRHITQVLKFAAPIVGPWIGMTAPPQYTEKFKERIELMKALVEKLPEEKPSREPELMKSVGEHERAERVAGAPLRALRELLHEKDKNHVWGGLQKILTPEGDYLWLCEQHAKPYLPPVKVKTEKSDSRQNETTL